jgi:hypothetical protein
MPTGAAKASILVPRQARRRQTGATLPLANAVRQAVIWVDVAQITMQFLY